MSSKDDDDNIESAKLSSDYSFSFKWDAGGYICLNEQSDDDTEDDILL